jgi:hypothetical protein
MLEHISYSIAGRLVAHPHVDIVLEYSSVSWPDAKHHRYQVTTFCLKFFIFYEVTKVCNGPELLGHSYLAALCRSLYQIKIHKAMCDDKCEADIIFYKYFRENN